MGHTSALQTSRYGLEFICVAEGVDCDQTCTHVTCKNINPIYPINLMQWLKYTVVRKTMQKILLWPF